MRKFVTLDIEDGVALVRLANPPVNPLSAGVVEELRSVIIECRLDDGVRALVLTGSPTHFAAGGDIKEFGAVTPYDFEKKLRLLHDCLAALEHLPVPTIAAIEGAAVGGGWELALACDLRIASTATRIGLPEIKLGLLAAAGGTQRMLYVLGKGRVLEMLYTGKLLSAEEAHALGLVERLSPPGETLAAALELARKLGTSSRPALAAAKACVLSGLENGLPAGWRREQQLGCELFAGDDAREGVRAFIEKRPVMFR